MELRSGKCRSTEKSTFAHQAITWTNVDPNLCDHKASLGHNGSAKARVRCSHYVVHYCGSTRWLLWFSVVNVSQILQGYWHYHWDNHNISPGSVHQSWSTQKKNPGTQHFHYSDVTMSAMMSQITGVSIVCSTVDQKIYQSSASQAFVRGIHWSQVDSSQRAGNAENVPIWWRHHAECMLDPVQN